MNVLDDWLKKYGNKEFDKQIEQEALDILLDELKRLEKENAKFRLNKGALVNKFTSNDIDKAFMVGCMNVGGLEGLDKELKRLKELGFKTPTEALLAIKNSKQFPPM